MSDQSRAAAPSDSEPAIVQKGAFLVAGVRYAGKNEHGEVPAMWDKDFIPRVGELVAEPARGFVAYGAIRMPPDAPPGVFEYLAAVEVKSLANLPTGMVGWEIPAQAYAVFKANGVPDLDRAFGSFYREWLPQSKEFGEADGPYLEVYPETFSQDGIIHVHCPVRRKQA